METQPMDRIWASRIWDADKTIEQATKVVRKESVKYVMRQNVAKKEPVRTAELYEIRTGEPYAPNED